MGETSGRQVNQLIATIDRTAVVAVIECPKCGETEERRNFIDFVYFIDGVAPSYKIDHRCSKCGHKSRVTVSFKSKITLEDR